MRLRLAAGLAALLLAACAQPPAGPSPSDGFRVGGWLSADVAASCGRVFRGLTQAELQARGEAVLFADSRRLDPEGGAATPSGMSLYGDPVENFAFVRCVFDDGGANLSLFLIDAGRWRLTGTHGYGPPSVTDDYRPGGAVYDDVVVAAGDVVDLGRLDWTLREGAHDLPRQTRDDRVSTAFEALAPRLGAAAIFMPLETRGTWCAKAPEDCEGR